MEGSEHIQEMMRNRENWLLRDRLWLVGYRHGMEGKLPKCGLLGSEASEHPAVVWVFPCLRKAEDASGLGRTIHAQLSSAPGMGGEGLPTTFCPVFLGLMLPVLPVRQPVCHQLSLAPRRADFQQVLEGRS